MHARDKFKSDVFHLALKHQNKLLAVFFLGEKIDTTIRMATYQCAIALRRVPAPALLDDIHALDAYNPSGNLYSADIRGIKMIVTRIADQSLFEKIQNPYYFEPHSFKK